MKEVLVRTILAVLLLGSMSAGTVGAEKTASPRAASDGFEFIDTSFENASPIWYERSDDGVINVYLLYDHERSSPNRAAGHFHFQVHGRAGTNLTFEFRNLENVWNGQSSLIARELKAAVISEDGRHWKAVSLESVPTNRVRLTLKMPADAVYVARVEPYRLSDLDRLLQSISKEPSVKVETIGRTVQDRPLEVITLGNKSARNRVFLRARAHPWEAGSSWVVEGFMRRLLRGDEESRKYLSRYAVYILPMANKDGVANGRTRFNLHGKDLNRNWDEPADGRYSPENAALERWLEARIAEGAAPNLALELHNDGNGQLHISRPPRADLDTYLERMKRLEQLLRQYTWFREGSTGATFRNSGTLGDGWLERYGIDAAVHEFNCNWIAGINDFPSAQHWIEYGEALGRVFYDYFEK